MQHVGIVQAICGTETPIPVLQQVISAARQHVEQLPVVPGVDLDIAAAEQRSVVALSLAHLAQQQWQQLLAAAEGDEMLVHDQVSELAMACDWQGDGQGAGDLVRIIDEISIPAHWHRLQPAALWTSEAEAAFAAVLLEHNDQDAESSQQLLTALREKMAPLMPAQSLAQLDWYGWGAIAPQCRRPVQNPGGYLQQSVRHAALAQRRQRRREQTSWYDDDGHDYLAELADKESSLAIQDDSSARQLGCMNALASVMTDACAEPQQWHRHAQAWLLQGQLVYREQDQQSALQQEYLGTPEELAVLTPAAAAARLADGLAQAYADLWCEDVLLAARLRPAEMAPWRQRPVKEAAAQDDKFAAWSLEIMLRAIADYTDGPTQEFFGDSGSMLETCCHRSSWAQSFMPVLRSGPE